MGRLGKAGHGRRGRARLGGPSQGEARYGRGMSEAIVVRDENGVAQVIVPVVRIENEEGIRWIAERPVQALQGETVALEEVPDE